MDSSGTIRVAVIGCGWAGSQHARAYAECGAEVDWLVDTNPERANQLQKRYPEARTDTDYRKALADPGINAVSVCLPHNIHANVTVDAVESGKHVLCEKPIAASLDEADRMIETADRASVVLMVAENERFEPLAQRVKTLLDDGAIGNPALVQVTRETYLTSSFLKDRPWFLDAKAAAGGIMMSGGIHDFEKMRMLIGEIESVYVLRARQRFNEMQGDDTSVVAIRFKNGTAGTLVESFVMKSLATASGPEVHTLRIDGDLGSISVGDGQTIRLFSERKDFRSLGELVQHDIHVPQADTFVLETEHFLDCIRTGKEPITSGRSQRRPLVIVLAAYESMETGQPVRL